MISNQPWAYFLPTPEEQVRITKRRTFTYLVLTFGFLGVYYFSYDVVWLGGVELHTIMEVSATLIALVVGALALMKYYIEPSTMLLLLGAGFIGTAFLDGYHALVSSNYFREFMPSDMSSLLPWSWTASRIFLSILLFLNFSMLYREKEKGKVWHTKPGQVYFWVSVATLTSFIFFALIPLPTGYVPEGVVHRPEEFIPGLFFLGAIIACLLIGRWKTSTLYNWVAVGLIINVISQFLFMPYSSGLFDYQFDAAHFLKIVSYICFFMGLFFNTYEHFNLVKREEALQKTISDTLVDGLFMIDSKGILQMVNRSGRQIFGYMEEELIGKNVNMLMGNVDAPRHDGYIRNFIQTHDAKIIGKQPREVIGKTRYGRVIDLELAVGELHLGENEFFIGTLRDITDKKQILRESFEELEQFAYIASHDLKTPLKGINTLAGWIQKDLGSKLTGESAENIEILRERVRRMENLLDDILSYSRASRANVKLKRVNLNVVMEELTGLINIPKGFEVKVSGRLPMVMAPKGSFEQIFSNLINNALKHHDKKEGVVTISSKTVYSGEGEEMWEILVSDDGPGIAPKYQEQIFKMFQTLESKDDIEGSGLGLSIVRRLVTKQSGEVNVDSEDGKRGTTFRFTWSKIKNKHDKKNVSEQKT